MKKILVQWFITLFDNNTFSGAVQNENVSNQELGE